LPAPGARKHGTAGGKEAAVAHNCSVDVRVRADEYVVPENGRMFRATAQRRVLHHNASCAHLDAAVLCGDDRAKQHSGVRSHANVAALDSRRGCRVNGLRVTAVLDQHAVIVQHLIGPCGIDHAGCQAASDRNESSPEVACWGRSSARKWP
jgi:hypothetical protein